jgi:hypothetical protein
MTKILTYIHKIGGYGGNKVICSLVSGWSTRRDDNKFDGNNIFLGEKNTFKVDNNGILDKILLVLKNNTEIRRISYPRDNNRVYLDNSHILVIMDYIGGLISNISTIRVCSLPMNLSSNNQTTSDKFFYKSLEEGKIC